jgi:hypothetical protein
MMAKTDAHQTAVRGKMSESRHTISGNPQGDISEMSSKGAHKKTGGKRHRGHGFRKLMR